MVGTLEEKMAGALEEKVVDFKGRKIGEGGKTKEKDIMKRRQEGGEEEKNMGTEKKEEETDEKGVEKEKRRGIEEGRRGIEEREEKRKENGECGTKDVPPPLLRKHSLAKS